MNRFILFLAFFFTSEIQASLTSDSLSYFPKLDPQEKENFVIVFQNEDSRLHSFNNDPADLSVSNDKVKQVSFINLAFADENTVDSKIIEEGFIRGSTTRHNPNPCFIAGWVMTKVNGKCPRPDSKRVGPEYDYMRSLEMNHFTKLHDEKVNDVGYPLINSCKKNSRLNVVCNPLIYGYKNKNNEPLCTSSNSDMKDEESCLFQSRNTTSKGYYPEDRIKGIIDLVEKYPQKILDHFESMAQTCLCSQEKVIKEQTKSVKNGQYYENGEPKYDEVYKHSYIESKNREEANVLGNSEYSSKDSALEAIKDSEELSSSSECFSFLNRMTDFSSKLKSCEEKIAILEIKNYQISSFTDFFNELNQNEDFQKIEKNIFSSKHRYIKERREFLKKLSSESKTKAFCSIWLNEKNYELSKRNECIKSYSEWKSVIDANLIENLEERIKSKNLDFTKDACKVFDELYADNDIDIKKYGHINYEGGKAWGKKFEIQNAISNSSISNSRKKLELKDIEVEQNFTVQKISQSNNNNNKSSGGFFGGVADFFSGMFGGMTQETANGIAGAIAYAIEGGDTQQNMASPYTFNSPYSNIGTSPQWNSTISNQFTYSSSFGTYK